LSFSNVGGRYASDDAGLPGANGVSDNGSDQSDMLGNGARRLVGG